AVHRHYHANPVSTGAFDGFRHRPAGNNESHAIIAVEMGGRWRKRGQLEVRFGIDELETQPLRINRNAADTMRTKTAKVGLQKTLCNAGRILGGQAVTSKNRRDGGEAIFIGDLVRSAFHRGVSHASISTAKLSHIHPVLMSTLHAATGQIPLAVHS